MSGGTAGIAPGAGGLQGWLSAAASGSAGLPGSRGLAVATLVSWIATEGLGAYMLRSWFASGGMRRRHRDPGGVSLPVMLGHAGLAFTGFVCWLIFVATAAPPAAWLAIGFLGPGIGFGISTVTVWTPYPGQRADDSEWSYTSRGMPPEGTGPSEKTLTATLADESLTSMLVDDTVDRLLDAGEPRPGRRGWNLKPLIPAAHGVLAIATFLLAMLAAVTAL
jgi:hypothetical protein